MLAYCMTNGIRVKQSLQLTRAILAMRVLSCMVSGRLFATRRRLFNNLINQKEKVSGLKLKACD